MRKILFGLLLAASLLTACALGEGEPVYTVNGVYDAQAQALSVSMTVRYTNRTGKDLTDVYFCVYANLFRRESTLPFDNASLPEVFPDYYAPSGIALGYVGFDGERARYAFRGENECFLRVECDLPAGKTGVFRFDYTLLLSENRSFQGCGRDVRPGLWMPQAAVYSEDGFILNAPSRAGDFAFFEPSDFDITLTIPADCALACGTESELLSSDGEMSTRRFVMKGVSEAALVFSNRFYTVSDRAEGISLTAYGNRKGELKKILARTEELLTAYETTLGAFPYERLTVVCADAVQSASRPGILILGDDAQKDSLLLPRLLARQYFTCAVNTDPSTDPFLTDGIAEYVSLLSIEETKGREAFLQAMREEIEPSLRMTIPGGLTPDAYLTRFASRSEYDSIVVRRGAAVLHELRDTMGRENFLAALRIYYENGRGKTVTISDFVSALDAAAGKEMGPALINWLYTIDDYANTAFDIYD